MSQVVWQVRRKGHYYNQTVSNPQGTNHYGPFEEYVGEHLPSDFEGEVVRRVVFDVPKYQAEGYQPGIKPEDGTEMYGGPAD